MDRIPGQAVGGSAVLFEPFALAFKVRKARFGRFKLFRQSRHAVAMRAGVIAPVSQFFARIGEFLRDAGLFLLRFGGGFLSLRHAFLCDVSRLTRLLGRGGGLAPAGEQDARFGGVNLIGQLGVTFRLLGLTAQRSHLRIETRHQIFEPRQVRLGRAQFAFRILAPHMQARNSGRLFKHLAARGGFGGDDLRDLALAHQSGRMRAGGRIGKGERHILGAHIVAVDAIGRARAALDPAGDDQLLAGIILGVKHDFGKAALGPGGRAGKDHVFHPARAHRLGRGFPHDPADRFQNVGFAAAIRADNAG